MADTTNIMLVIIEQSIWNAKKTFYNNRHHGEVDYRYLKSQDLYDMFHSP